MQQIPFLFTVNDDLFIKNILSGAYLGKPDAHTVYMEYPLSFFLKSLYEMNDYIPWYGILLFLFQIFAWFCIGYCLIRCQKNKPARIMAGAFLISLFGAVGFYHMASMQYTVTSAILGTAALVWFYTSKQELSFKAFLKNQSVTFLLVFLSFNVRRNVLLMLLPIAAAIYFDYFIKTKEVKKMTAFAAGIFVPLLGTALITAAGYSSKEWADYQTYNDHATILYDYYGWPDYEENKDLYHDLSISKEAWYGAKSAYLLSMDAGIDKSAMVQLAKRSEEIHRENNSVWDLTIDTFKAIASRATSDIDRPLNLVVICLYLVCFLFVVRKRQWKTGITLLFLWAGRMISWFYLVYQGRYPARITQSLLLAECFVLAAVFLKTFFANEIQNRLLYDKYMVMTILALTVLLTGTSYLRVRHVMNEFSVRMKDSQDLQELKQYCAKRKDNFYFVDVRSITNDTETIFDPRGSQFENYIVFGGWLSGSPAYRDKLNLAGITDAEDALLHDGNVYVVEQVNREQGIKYLTDYFASRYPGFEYRLVDKFGSGDQPFYVYRFLEE